LKIGGEVDAGVGFEEEVFRKLGEMPMIPLVGAEGEGFAERSGVDVDGEGGLIFEGNGSGCQREDARCLEREDQGIGRGFFGVRCERAGIEGISEGKGVGLITVKIEGRGETQGAANGEVKGLAIEIKRMGMSPGDGDFPGDEVGIERDLERGGRAIGSEVEGSEPSAGEGGKKRERGVMRVRFGIIFPAPDALDGKRGNEG